LLVLDADPHRGHVAERRRALAADPYRWQQAAHHQRCIGT
jgi:hypothetical protein